MGAMANERTGSSSQEGQCPGRSRRAMLGCAFLASLLLGSACSGSGAGSSSGGQAGAAGGVSSVAETTTTPPPSPYGSSPFSFQTRTGWNYSFTPAFGSFTVSVSKDVSQSPPGKARVRISVTASRPPGFPGELKSTDVGRTAPPIQLQRYLTLGWRLPQAVAQSLFSQSLDFPIFSADGCVAESPGSGGIEVISGDDPPSPNNLLGFPKGTFYYSCAVTLSNLDGSAPSASDDYESDDADESVIDAFIAASSFFNSPPNVLVAASTDDGGGFTHAFAPIG
jgi:hypothetical protein